MNAINLKITTISDDLNHIIRKIPDNSIDITRFCQDHDNPYFLSDKRPVLSITQDDLLRIFSYNSSHLFLLPEHAARIGEYCKLPLPNTLALMIKADWELFIASSIDNKYTPDNLRIHLIDYELIATYSKYFIVHRDRLCQLIVNSSVFTDKNFTYDYISFIISDLLKENRFLVDNGEIGRLYPEKEVTESTFISDLQITQRSDYNQAKELWRTKSSELDEMLFILERKKRMNLNIENRYFRTFGTLESEKLRVLASVEKYRIILSILLEEPGLSIRELMILSSKKMIEENRKLAEIRSKIDRSLNYITHTGIGEIFPQVSSEFRQLYLQECKKLIRKLFFLLHSDTCPNYALLSDNQKGEVNSLWLTLMKSTNEELASYSPSMLLYHLPDYEQLESIYLRACKILDINPESFESGDQLELMLRRGTPYSEIMEFLKTETERLELHLAHLELIRDVYSNENQTKYYSKAIKDINTHTTLLEKEIAEMKQNLTDLKQKIRTMIESVQHES